MDRSSSSSLDLGAAPSVRQATYLAAAKSYQQGESTARVADEAARLVGVQSPPVVLTPCTVKAAKALVKQWHRHLPDVQGGLFAVRCVDSSGEVVGVGIAGNPSRVWQGEAKLVISRLATTGHGNACSAIYGALCRAAKALGYAEVWTYTLPEEPGTSLRAAGFVDMGLSAGGTYSRPSRSRKAPVRPEPKRRWRRVLAGGGQ